MITLGNKNELFLDDTLLERAEGVLFDWLRPERHGCAFRYDAPWEGEACTYQTLIQHPETGKIYLYYRGTSVTNNDFSLEQVTCLAVSDDGVRFDRVDTGNGNIVLADTIACHNFAPFYDENPVCREDERFKAVGLTRYQDENGQTREGLVAYTSPDGIRWTLVSETPVITDGMFDSLNTVFWDRCTEKYRCYSRYWTGEGYNGLRAIQSCESEDFIHWSKQTHNTYNGGMPSPYAFYTNATRPVPGAEHQYIAIPMRFVPDRKKVEAHPEPGISDCVLLSSRDGYDWVMRGARPWVYPGLDERQWTQRNFILGAGIVEKDDRFHFYSTEHYCWDDNGLYHYSVPKNRLGYVYSPWGNFVTKPFVLQGTRLTFNYNTSAVGSLTVQVLDETGAPLEGYGCTLYGNELACPMELSALAGRTLKLAVTLEDAYLYSIGF